MLKIFCFQVQFLKVQRGAPTFPNQWKETGEPVTHPQRQYVGKSAMCSVFFKKMSIRAPQGRNRDWVPILALLPTCVEWRCFVLVLTFLSFFCYKISRIISATGSQECYEVPKLCSQVSGSTLVFNVVITTNGVLCCQPESVTLPFYAMLLHL